MVYLVPHFPIFMLFLVISLLKIAHKCSTEVLSGVPECKKAFVEKILTLEKLHSGISCSAVGPEFSVNVSTIYIK